ncbi:aldehyde ferredoxin oxidoreductase C-terminal domain-containing protein, partial [Chloroflexota bacterium]
LEWGDEEATIELLHKIARREGFGDVLADGTFKAAQKIGKSAERYAMHVGGATLSPYDFRSRLELAQHSRVTQLGHLTCPRGGDNLRSTHICGRYLPAGGGAAAWYDSRLSQEEMTRQLVSDLDMPDEVKKQVYGTPPRLKPMSYEGAPTLTIFSERMVTLHNMLGLCFTGTPVYGPAYCSRFLTAVAGIELGPEEILELGDRVFTLQWAFNAREGITVRSLDFPTRFYEDPIPDGPSQGDVLCREEVGSAMDEYYGLRHWDKETGLPTKERLEELGLSEVIGDLEQRGLLH